ncbi:MAG: 6-deoxy-6-sulfogluconolactonase [Verrucomicrobia subdivision 3 bacterium]|nr:6-deoxy-6-sulfogluconolactonase [Limisphaerales bacterium]MCS1415788.1 6-deoxy-6-sulfogluconolactonase [Limisphaerales bacterium]
MTRFQAECVYSGKAVLAEGPVWDEVAQLLYWLDIERGKICRFDPASKGNEEWILGTRVGFAVNTEKGDMLAGTQEGLIRFSCGTGTSTPFAKPEAELPDNRFNDGKCDLQGRLWAGTMSMDETKTAGSLYRVDEDGSLSQHADMVRISNGLAWSSDSRKMYYIDSPTQRVDVFDYDAAGGENSNRRPVIDLTGESFFPDGMTIDVEDKLWVALWEGWGVGRFDPATGEMIAKVEVPVACVTSCCFGGPDLEDLYITTASRSMKVEDWNQQPDAGGIFIARPDVKGTPSIRFKG